MRVADYIAERIAGLGVRHVFLVTGGGAMHLDDALGLRADLEVVCDHHEQACAIAAEGYARRTGGMGVACVTTGPGGTNAITGVLGCWHDSVPVLVVSGQVRYDTMVASTRLPLRQLGDQEADIVRMVAPITKYAALIDDPAKVRYCFDKAVWLATHGRPGPVWLDVPLNVQGAQQDTDALKGFDPRELDDEAAPGKDENAAAGVLPAWSPVEPAAQAPGAFRGRFDREAARDAAGETLRRLRAAAHPVILAGSGVHAAAAEDLFLRAIDTLDVPVCTAWNAHDLLWDEHPLYAGRPGSIGDRAGNFVAQNADVLLSLGCRLNVRQVGYEFPAFAHDAFRIVVDLDEAELAKPTILPDLPVHADLGFFLEELARLAAAEAPAPHAEWMAWCHERRRRYPVVLPEYRRPAEPVNPYVFVDVLSRRLERHDTVVCANGSACVVTLQALILRRGQRLFVNSGTAGMGYDLPASIGAAFALRSGAAAAGAGSSGRRATAGRVVCLAGDGSIQMNLQELQTIVHHELPIKVFVFDNAGYASIRQTQDNLFAGRRVGEGPQSGVSFPDLVRVAEVYGIPATRVTRHEELDEAIGATLVSAGPALLDVVMDPDQGFAPKVVAERLPDGTIVSKPLEDMFPFLDRMEFAENMIVPPYGLGSGETVNELERKMVEQLQDLRENHNVIGVKAEFEAEGTRLEEAVRLKEVISAAGLGLTMKVGGCEAVRDMYEARVIGVDRVVGPMVESPWAFHKFVQAVRMAFPAEERDQVQFCINVETTTGVANFPAMLALSDSVELDGIVLGRVDMSGSMGLTREDINSEALYDVAEELFTRAKGAGLECALGGGVSADSLDFMRRLPRGCLDRYETRKVVFSCPEALGDDADKGILKAVGFELMWLKNKRDFYGCIFEEDHARIEMLQGRYDRLIEQAGGLYG